MKRTAAALLNWILLMIGCSAPPERDAINKVLAALSADVGSLGYVMCSGVYLDGCYVYAEARDALFWVKEDTVYSVSESARQIAPQLPVAPEQIVEAELRSQLEPTGLSDAMNVIACNSLTPEQVAKKEAALRDHPDDLNVRACLVTYYAVQRFHSPEATEEYGRHLLYLIEHFPASSAAGAVDAVPEAAMEPLLCDKMNTLWLAHVDKQPDNPRILMNAAQFFLMSDPNQAEALLKKGAALEPRAWIWPYRLSELWTLKLQTLSGPARMEPAKKALAYNEEALALQGETSSLDHARLAEKAFEAGEFEKASKSAQLAISGDKEDGDSLHTAHTVLGRIALKEGRTSDAAGHLRASLKVKKGAVINSFGPEFTLAQELLSAGEKDAVLDFLDQCLQLDISDDYEELKRWKAEIEAGGQPEFKRH